MYAVLKLFVGDIMPENYVPSYADGNSIVDFLLPDYSLVIGTKMTNKSISDEQIGDQLIIDIARYKQLGNKQLVCFVYDKEPFISNPHGLIEDLEGLSDQAMQVTLFLRNSSGHYL